MPVSPLLAVTLFYFLPTLGVPGTISTASSSCGTLAVDRPRHPALGHTFSLSCGGTDFQGLCYVYTRAKPVVFLWLSK